MNKYKAMVIAWFVILSGAMACAAGGEKLSAKVRTRGAGSEVEVIVQYRTASTLR